MVIRSAIFNALFWIWIVVLGLAGLPICLVYPPFSFVISRIWALGTLSMLRVLCGITHEIRGHEYIPATAAIIASKHQSAWDTVIFWTLLKRPAYVLKRELLWFPVFGWYLLLLRSIYIDRKAGASALKRILREAQDRVTRGSSIVIFPEGTRIAVGAPSSYQPGVAALYQHLDVPVVPVALNSGKFWSKNAFVKTPGKITIEFLPPIASGLKSREFLKQLQDSIENKAAELIAL